MRRTEILDAGPPGTTRYYELAVPDRVRLRPVLVCEYKPRFAVGIVVQQLAVPLFPHVSRPNNRGRVDVGCVEYPFVIMNAVAGCIPDDQQVFASLRQDPVGHILAEVRSV